MSPALVPDLRSTVRPGFESGEHSLRIADLFCGCGALTLGIAQAAHSVNVALDVSLAVDFDPDATAAYLTNFGSATVITAKAEALFDGDFGEPYLTDAEAKVVDETGDIHALVGGPPCQGHSDLNNYTRRDDPKNAYYRLMSRAASVLGPKVVLIENVPAVRHDKGGVVAAVTSDLQDLGYRTADAVLRMDRLGIAQRRKRHVLLACDEDLPDPKDVLQKVATTDHGKVDLRAAIADLADVNDRKGLDVAPNASPPNIERMQWLLDNNKYDLPNELRPKCHQDDHSYKSMYGRLRWTEPAQTITSGYGSIGQGRYMHPSFARALTPHEAARLQGLPDYFRFPDDTRRASLARMIGNAVPPALSRHVFSELIDALVDRDAPRASGPSSNSAQHTS